MVDGDGWLVVEEVVVEVGGDGRGVVAAMLAQLNEVVWW